MNPADDFTADCQRMIDEAPKPAAKAPSSKPKGMDAPPAPIHKVDEQRQLEVPYSHEAMIDLMIINPTWPSIKLAKHYGQTPGWLASIVASDEFQQALDPRRSLVRSPFITATLEERFRGLTLRSLEVLQARLDDPKVQDATILKAAEIGIKALGLGQKKDEDDDKPKVNSLDRLADLLTANLRAKGGNMIAAHEGQGGNAADADDEDEAEIVQEMKEVPNA